MRLIGNSIQLVGPKWNVHACWWRCSSASPTPRGSLGRAADVLYARTCGIMNATFDADDHDADDDELKLKLRLRLSDPDREVQLRSN